MQNQYVLSKAEWDTIQDNTHQLNQIAFLVSKFAIRTEMTTLDCIMALMEREQMLTAKLDK
jgi:hypothetical protein